MTTEASVLLDDQQAVISSEGVNAAGNVVPLPAGSSAAWKSSDATILTVTPEASDSTKANAVTTGKVGSATVTATITLPSGAVLPDATLDINVQADATPKTIQLSLGTPSSRLPAA